jgi:molybdate transport system permease protein
MLQHARSPLPWLGGLLALYLLAPIVAFVVRLHDGVAATPGLGDALATSLLTATIATIAIASLGVPLAYLIAHLPHPLRRVALALASLPLALPPLASGLLLLYVLGPYTALGEAFGGQLTDTRVGIVLAQTFVASPFLVLAADAAFAGVDPALEEVARAHSYRPLARFWGIAVPAALPGIAAGLLLAWLRAFGEFGATVILAYHPYTLPVFAFVQFGSTGLPATAAPVAAALAAALAFVLLSGLRPPRRRSSTFRRSYRSKPIEPAGPIEPAEPPAALDFDVRKRLGRFSLALAHRGEGPRLALLGPSGAGKTLTLRLLAGLTPGEGGHVRAGTSALHALRCERRVIGYVPQHSALVPRRPVWRQVCGGPRAQPQLAAFWFERLGLAGLEHRRPEELSGGQQRRVAIARALATAPRVLLLDEPFAGLDAPVRDRLRRELRRLQRELALSTVIVTHDPEEAAMLADEIVVLDAGRVLQAGTRTEVFHAPVSPHVAALLGIANAHGGHVGEAGVVHSDGVELRAPTGGLPVGCEVVWCVRPEHVRVSDRAAQGGMTARDGAASVYDATLLDEIDLGAVRELTLSLGRSLELAVRTTEPTACEVGERVLARIDPDDVAVWPQPPMYDISTFRGSNGRGARDLALAPDARSSE